MDERITGFIRSLKGHLDGLSEQEIKDAVSYYEEYFSDAIEEGKDPADILKELDPPEKIAGMIKMESSIIEAQRNPGLKSFTGVSRNAFKGVTAPLAVISLSLVVFISFCMVAVFFAGAFAFFAGAAMISLGLVYEAIKIPQKYFMEIAGTIGFGLLGAGISILVAFSLYRIGKLFIRLAAQLIRRILLKSGKPMPEMEKQTAGQWVRFRTVLIICLAVVSLGVVAIGVSGLPVRFFTIFNSMKPANIETITNEYDPASINKISIETTNSNIRIARGTSDKVVITYEKTDYLDYDMGISGSMLSFFEKSNGRLPLFSLVTIHEGMTNLTVSIPKGLDPDVINLETRGGHIYITGLADNIRAVSFSNSINYSTENLEEDVNIKASTWSGNIFLKGTGAGRKTSEGMEYYKDVDARKTVELKSSNGNIKID